MPAITLPPTFTNSFWSQDYRRGLETLFGKLEQGIAENSEIINFIQARAIAEHNLASSLVYPAPTGQRGTGFAADDGASLLMAFWGLKQESIAQGEIHKALAKDLDELVLTPFSAWAQQHETRVKSAKEVLVDEWVDAYESSAAEVAKLKESYLSKTRKADETEDDAKFAPNNDYSEHYTATSPRSNARQTIVNRTASVSERIAERLKELRTGKPDAKLPSEPHVESSATTAVESHTEKAEDVETTPKLDKGKGKAVEISSPIALTPPTSPPPVPPTKAAAAPPPRALTPMLLAGISLSPAAVSALLRRAKDGLPLRPVRLPILGEYPDCFTGEEFVAWLKDNFEAFGGNLDLAEEAARELTEDENLLRRIGDLGNYFEPTSEAFYQFRTKAFNLEEAHTQINSTNTPSVNLQPVANNLLKRSGTLANFVIKQIKTGGGPPPHVRARVEAEEADHSYRAAVRQLDRQRLALEDKIEENLKILQRWETDRLRAIKTVLLQYQGMVANLPSSLQPSNERSSTLIATYQPDSDLIALIERYRTGPFRPAPQIYESISHDGTDVVFGIDLGKWAGESGWAAVRVPEEEKEKKKNAIPPVVGSLLNALKKSYETTPSDEERRRAWIYEVPLPLVHHLREAINGQPPNVEISAEFFEKCDAPVLASVLKLWLLELQPPLGTWEGWDDIKKIYPTVGGKIDTSDGHHIEDLQLALAHLPKVHLHVLDAIIRHIKDLLSSTKTDEDEEVYLTKLAYSLGRCILRPKVETEISIQDRHHTLLFMDLVKQYDKVIPPTIERKKRESDRPLPMRKRTALVDQRINRRSVGVDPKHLLEVREAQIVEQKRLSRASSPARLDPVPPIPAIPAVTKEGLPPRPKFATPPPENEDGAPNPLIVSPPTPERVGTPTSPKSATSSVGQHSHGSDDKSIGASLSRSASGEASRVRPSRVIGVTRGPRAAPGSAAVSPTSHVRAASRTSIGSDSARHPVADPKEYVPKKKDGRTNASAFSRRTMASGSEDEVVQK